MGSDHGDNESEAGDVVFVDENEMEQLEAMADAEEAAALAGDDGDSVNDFETFKESEFGEGEEYEDGQVI